MNRVDDLPNAANDAVRRNLQGMNGGNNSDQLNMMQAQQNAARLLEVLGDQSAGRGVPKPTYTPAMLNGLTPQNPRFFGMQAKYPIPYQSIVGSDQNMQAVLKGFDETRMAKGGILSEDPAQLLQQVQRQGSLLSEVFNTKQRESLYSGVRRDPAANLMEINLKNRRENSLYAFQ